MIEPSRKLGDLYLKLRKKKKQKTLYGDQHLGSLGLTEEGASEVV